MKKSVAKATRRSHSEEFRTEALRLADQVGVAAAARQLNLHPSQMYQWRGKAQHQASVTRRESELATENARLKRLLGQKSEEVDILKKAATYFALNQK
jgi:transposase